MKWIRGGGIRIRIDRTWMPIRIRQNDANPTGFGSTTLLKIYFCLVPAQGDFQIISNVARTLELTVPLIEHPSEIFLSQLEAAAVRLIIQHDKTGESPAHRASQLEAADVRLII